MKLIHTLDLYRDAVIARIADLADNQFFGELLNGDLRIADGRKLQAEYLSTSWLRVVGYKVDAKDIGKVEGEESAFHQAKIYI